MLSLSVCTQSSKCCVIATGYISSNLPGAPTRVFLGVGKSCTDTPPIDPSATGWIEATSIVSLGGNDYQLTFPTISTNDPRCVTPCDSSYPVCVWSVDPNGIEHCGQLQPFNPASYCGSQPLGCPACMNANEP